MLRRGLGWEKVCGGGRGFRERLGKKCPWWFEKLGDVHGHGGEVRLGGNVSRGQSLGALGKQVGETHLDPQSNGGASAGFGRGVI